MKIQGKLEGVIKESHIEGLAGMYTSSKINYKADKKPLLPPVIMSPKYVAGLSLFVCKGK